MQKAGRALLVARAALLLHVHEELLVRAQVLARVLQVVLRVHQGNLRLRELRHLAPGFGRKAPEPRQKQRFYYHL